MARPPSRRDSLAGDSNGGADDEDCSAWHRPRQGKNVCSVVGLDRSGAVVVRRRVRRDTLIDLVAKLPSCIVGTEACCGAHHLGRLFAAQGHDVRLMSPEYVRPYVKAQKNDDRRPRLERGGAAGPRVCGSPWRALQQSFNCEGCRRSTIGAQAKSSPARSVAAVWNHQFWISRNLLLWNEIRSIRSRRPPSGQRPKQADEQHVCCGEKGKKRES